MEFGNFKIDIEKLVCELKKLGWKRIVLEATNGLKPYVKYISEILKKEGFEVYISGNDCYGPCDIDYLVAEFVKADGIVHVGHKKNLLGYKNFNLEER